MVKLKMLVVAAGALVLGGALAAGRAQAAVQDGPSALGVASENGALAEQVQFRWGGYNYCWYDDGWRGPGWYWCGYAYRAGFGWGGPVGWNNWRVFRDRDEHREHEFREFREFREHDHDRDWRR
jgi:hypothetical protein